MLRIFHNCQNEIIIVAIGNFLRADDGVSNLLIDSLDDELKKSVCIQDLGIQSNFIGPVIEGHKCAIIIDACISDKRFGNTYQINLKKMLNNQMLESNLNFMSTHSLNILDELRLASHNYFLPEQIFLFGIESKISEFSQSLSSELKRKLPKIKQNLEILVKKIKGNLQYA